MRLGGGAIQKGTVIRAMKRLAAIFTDRQTDRVAIRHSGARVPTGVVKIFFLAAIDYPGRHRATVIKTTELAEAEGRLIVNMAHARRVISVNLDESGHRAILFVSRSKVDS